MTEHPWWNHLGEACLTYLLNLDSAQVAAIREESSIPLSKEQIDLLALLHDVDSRMRLIWNLEELVEQEWRKWLSSATELRSPSHGNGIRQLAGG
ncbi:hypothetical protein [Changpingibacter yushuensis]|uniref:hypothetical protein n=1 Tax=Changpingibacter yushuensis TaxID=2758440 RepID=UPI0015F56B94|nr:hypothetical protein [Changpingibacter yushuensis]